MWKWIEENKKYIWGSLLTIIVWALVFFTLYGFILNAKENQNDDGFNSAFKEVNR